MAKVTEISSADNARFKFLQNLLNGKDLKKEKYFLVSGTKVVADFLRGRPWPVHCQLQKSKSQQSISEEFETWILAADLFREIDVNNSNDTMLVVGKPALPTIDLDDKPRGLEVVLPVGDPANLGACLRSCEAFGVTRVILTQESASPFLPKSVKASMGSLFRIQLLRGPKLGDFVGNSGHIALDIDGEDPATFAWPKNFRLILGEEGPGLSELKFKQRLTIPTQGVESLNAAVALGVALYAFKNMKSNQHS